MKRVDVMHVRLSFTDVLGNRGKFFSSFPNNGLAVDTHSVARKEFIRKTNVCDTHVDGQNINCWFITNGLTQEWISEILEDLERLRMKNIALLYADKDSECAGYVESIATGVSIAEHYSGGDYLGLSVKLLSVLRYWESTGHVFESKD